MFYEIVLHVFQGLHICVLHPRSLTILCWIQNQHVKSFSSPLTHQVLIFLFTSASGASLLHQLVSVWLKPLRSVQMMSQVQDGGARVRYAIQSFSKLNWSLVGLSQWNTPARSTVNNTLSLWCLRLNAGFQRIEIRPSGLYIAQLFFFPYCQTVAVAETCGWRCADAQTIKRCLWICSLSDYAIKLTVPLEIRNKKKPFTLISIRKQRNVDLPHTKPASLFAYKGGWKKKNLPQHRQNSLTTPLRSNPLC